MAATLTEKLADYTLHVTREQIDQRVWEQAKRCFVDCFGCLVAGASETAPVLAARYCRVIGAKPVATVIGAGLKTDSSNAAMVNGIAAHIHDLDDVSPSLIGHPSTVMLPTVLAVGQELQASAQEVLMAYIIGVEIAALLGRGLNPAHYGKGWHSTSTLGVFGATAAAGKLLRLNRDKLVCAFGIAASEASGLKGNFGSMTKSLHAGRAAAKGIFAAKMAELGYDANPRIMESGSGFIETTTGACDMSTIDRFFEEGGSEFLAPGMALKPYPSCKATHNAIDATLYLAKVNGISADEVESIEVMVQPVAKDILKYPVARTPLEGKFSMGYCIACALLYGNVTLANFRGQRIEDPRVVRLMERTNMVVDEHIADGKYFNGTWESSVKIKVKGGKEFEKSIRHAKGDPENPLSDEEIFAKLRGCFPAQADMAAIEKIEGMLRSLEDIQNVNDLVDIVDANVNSETVSRKT